MKFFVIGKRKNNIEQEKFAEYADEEAKKAVATAFFASSSAYSANFSCSILFFLLPITKNFIVDLHR